MRRLEHTTSHELELRKMFLSFKAQVVVPFGISVVTGAVVGAAVAVALRIVDIPTHNQAGFIAGAVFFIISWAFYTIWLRGEWKKLDGRQGASKQPVSHARYEATTTTEGGKTTTIYEFLYATPAQMATLADAIATHNGITVPLLERIFGSRMAATAIRDELIDKHYLRWRNPESPKQGMELTAKGRAFFSALANNPSLTRWSIPTKSAQVLRTTHTAHTQQVSGLPDTMPLREEVANEDE